MFDTSAPTYKASKTKINFCKTVYSQEKYEK